MLQRGKWHVRRSMGGGAQQGAWHNFLCLVHQGVRPAMSPLFAALGRWVGQAVERPPSFAGRGDGSMSVASDRGICSAFELPSERQLFLLKVGLRVRCDVAQ